MKELFNDSKLHWWNRSWIDEIQ